MANTQSILCKKRNRADEPTEEMDDASKEQYKMVKRRLVMIDLSNPVQGEELQHGGEKVLKVHKYGNHYSYHWNKCVCDSWIQMQHHIDCYNAEKAIAHDLQRIMSEESTKMFIARKNKTILVRALIRRTNQILQTFGSTYEAWRQNLWIYKYKVES